MIKALQQKPELRITSASFSKNIKLFIESSSSIQNPILTINKQGTLSFKAKLSHPFKLSGLKWALLRHILAYWPQPKSSKWTTYLFSAYTLTAFIDSLICEVHCCTLRKCIYTRWIIWKCVHCMSRKLCYLDSTFYGMISTWGHRNLSSEKIWKCVTRYRWCVSKTGTKMQKICQAINLEDEHGYDLLENNEVSDELLKKTNEITFARIKSDIESNFSCK